MTDPEATVLKRRHPWQKELEIIDRTMRDISTIADPDALVDAYWSSIGELIAMGDFVAVSRREVEPPYYVVTRSSRFTEHHNPWTQRDRLPKLSGGLLGELIYANRPRIIEDLPKRLSPDDPAQFYLEGFASLIALPQYDDGEAMNMSMLLVPPGVEIDYTMIPMMHWQASLFGRGTRNQVLRNELCAALTALDRELRVVGSIQRSLLPRTLPPIEGVELAAHYQTSARAGGDYYDFFPLDEDRWGVFIGDVSGHGTPAAVLMAITHAIAHAQPGTHTPPAALLDYLNNQLAGAYTRNGTFVTAFYAVLDPIRRTLAYARAGHNPPRLVRNGRVVPLEEIGALPLGIIGGQRYEEARVDLKPGDLLLLYTDGITEAVSADGAAGEMFGTQRLDRVLLDCGNAAPEACVERIRTELAAFCGNTPPADDQTLIAIRCA